MEYPILPGSVIPQDVGHVGQRTTMGRVPQRPNAVERHVQYVESLPMQAPVVYQQAPVAVQASVPSYQHIMVQPAGPPVVAHATLRTKAKRCCTTRLAVFASVLTVCIVIGTVAGVALYLRYGRNGGTGGGSNGGSEHHHNCVTVGDEDESSRPFKGDKDDDKHRPHRSDKYDDDDDNDDDDDDDDDKSRRKDHRPSKIPGCFHHSSNGTYTLDAHTDITYHDSEGKPHHIELTGTTTWVIGSGSNALTLQGSRPEGLPDGVSMCT